MRRRLAALLLCANIGRSMAGEPSYPTASALIVDTCPYVELTSFRFGNKTDLGKDRHHESLSWVNRGSQPLIAFEVTIVRFDAFNRAMPTIRWTVTGRNSTDWSPLPPGESSGDGLLGAPSEEVFTAISYVSAARLADNSVWLVDERELPSKLQKVTPPQTVKPQSQAKH
jgi:hypothetical protein